MGKNGSAFGFGNILKVNIYSTLVCLLLLCTMLYHLLLYIVVVGRAGGELEGYFGYMSRQCIFRCCRRRVAGVNVTTASHDAYF